MKKIKLDFTFKFKELDAQENKEIEVNKFVANAIARGQSEDPAAATSLAMKIYNDPVIEVTLIEFRIIEDIINKSIITNITKSQIQNYLKTIKTT